MRRGAGRASGSASECTRSQVSRLPIVAAGRDGVHKTLAVARSSAALAIEPATSPARSEITPSSLSDLTANPLILLKWYYFLEAKLLSLFKGLKISMMPSPTGC
jgi:hypothetical protein